VLLINPELSDDAAHPTRRLLKDGQGLRIAEDAQISRLHQIIRGVS
jgi:hypothetical protein